MISRRRFLGLAGGTALGGAAVWGGLVREHVSAAMSRGESTPGRSGEHVLVVLALNGGNDGLNTLVPADGRYHDARPTLGLIDSGTVALSGESRYRLHSALAPLVPLWGAGQLAAVESVGFAGSSRSHFQALEWWWTAHLDNHATTGWLGRWLDATAPPTDNPLRAVALASGTPALLATKTTGTVVLDPAQFAFRAPAGSSADQLVDALLATAAPLAPDPTTALAQRAMQSTVEAVRTFGRLSGGPSTDGVGETGRPEPLDVAGSLDVAANLIAADVGTRVIFVSVGGFDTHAAQAATQSRLLGGVADGVAKFFAALSAKDLADRVLLMTTSEFGRRVAENGSGGTDHGAGNVEFLVGPGVAGGIHGPLDLSALDDGDVRVAVDTRSLYTVGVEWLGGPVEPVLTKSYETLGLLKPATVSV